MNFDNIQTLQNNLSKVCALRPVSYNINLAPEKTSFGFITQEVELILPNAYFGVEYTAIIPFLVGAVQEQQAQLKLEKDKNDNQQTILNDLLTKTTILEQEKQTNLTQQLLIQDLLNRVMILESNQNK
jgi:hypothetical protein